MDYEQKYGFAPDTDSEMQGFEYTIPDGFTAEIRDGKVLVKKQSEDERIRKNILALVKKHAVNHERCQMEAYLEKQKEQKEQKPAEWSEEDANIIRNLQEILEQYGDEYYGTIAKAETIHWLKSLPDRFNLQPKQEWSEEDEKMMEEIRASYDSLEYQAELNGGNSALLIMQYKEELAWIENRLKSLRPQPKQEWSEEEKGILLECVSALQNSSHWLLADKLSSLRPQPKQEWGEEDKKMLGYIEDMVTFCYSNQYVVNVSISDKVRKWILKIKQNQCSLLLNDSDKQNIEKLIKILPQCIYRHPSILERDECRDLIDWLKSLRPQPHWKPSEEQMKQLEMIVNGKALFRTDFIKQLYNDLKKL